MSSALEESYSRLLGAYCIHVVHFLAGTSMDLATIASISESLGPLERQEFHEALLHFSDPPLIAELHRYFAWYWNLKKYSGNIKRP